MKISLLGPTYPYRGGISHYTTLLCRELRKEHEVQFLSFSRQYPKLIFPGKSDKDPSKKPLVVDEVDYCLDSINPFSWVQTASKIVKFNPNLLIIPWWVAFWAPQFMTVATLVKKRIKTDIVFICHNSVEHESSGWKVLTTRTVLGRGDRILTHSRQESERLLEILGPETMVTTAFHPSYVALCGETIEAAEAKRRLGLEGKVLLFFGFVREYKGLDLLLQAMPEVLRHENVSLLVVGEFWKDKCRYFQLVHDLGLEDSVHIVDSYIPNEEIGKYFAAADLVVQPYRSASGSGISQLAYGFGKPVIATDVGGLAEVVQDGVNGKVLKPDDVTELSEAIKGILSCNKLKAMTQQALCTGERFSWKTLTKMICSDGTNAHN